MPAPHAAILGSGVLLLLGGLSMVLGVRPTWGVICLVLFLVPVSFTMHNFWADTDPQGRGSNRIQFQKNIALLGAALMVLSIPQPWALSIGY